MKKILSLAIVFVLIFAFSVTAFAAETKGTITIENTTSDATYNVYKIFDATVSKDGDIAYKYDGELTGTIATYFSVDKAKNVTVKAAAYAKDSTTDLNADAIKAIADFKTAKSIAAATTAKTGNGGTISFTGLDFGYYYVESSVGAAVTITSTTPTAKVIDKNPSRPGPTDGKTNYKTVAEGDKQVTATTASIGDTVSFQVAFKALNFDTIKDETTGKVTSKQIVKYVVTDIPAGMTIDWKNVTITVGGKKITSNYTVTAAKNEVELTWAKAADKSVIYASPVDVVITYKAEVTAAGTSTNDITITSVYADGSDNKFKTKGEDSSDVTVKNYNLTIKNTESDGSTALSGAKFVLRDSGKNEIKLILEKAGEYRVATPEEAAADGFKSAVIEAGTAVIKGLKNGDYYVEQTVAPDGYNKLVDYKSVTIKDADNTATIKNSKGTVLPVTGSSTTVVLVALGSLAILVAGVFLVTNKRMSKEAI